MGQLVYACMTPHGGEIIPELAGPYMTRMAKTRESMKTLAQRMKDSDPDAIVVFTPHGIRIDGQISIVNSETVEGYEKENGRTYTMIREVERHLARLISEEASVDGVPNGLLNYGTSEGPLSKLPLDWGALVPLAFMPDVPVVVITPSRLVSEEDMKKFGQAVKRAIEKSDLKVGVIASCDWCHTHDASGPYGFHPSAKKVDEQIVEYIKTGRLESVSDFTPEEIENAKPDGIWQTLMLAGAVPAEERQVEFLSYEAPTYFGLICAEIKK
ncbi:MAG: extradiol ring-cleavage dioxygenase [Tuberibacillus sp.]